MTKPSPRRMGRLRLAELCIIASASLLLAGAVLAAESGREPDAAQAHIEAALRELAHDPLFADLSEAQRRDEIEFVAGNLIFATMHEVGHMLVSEMGLPVLGHEEDAADTFATLAGLKLENVFSNRVLAQTARGWFLSDRRNRKQGVRTAFYDEHGFDQQRAYDIVCLMVGSNRNRFASLADMAKMPPARQNACQGDYNNAFWSWRTLLKPHLRSPDTPKVAITTTYADPGPYVLMQRGIEQIRLLEAIADYLADRFAWRRPVGIEMRTCGEPAAHWDLPTSKIVICYELAADFAALYRGYLSE